MLVSEQTSRAADGYLAGQLKCCVDAVGIRTGRILKGTHVKEIWA
jgi:hypothetical protein